MPKKDSLTSQAFQSFRVIGKKAQDIMQQAKDSAKKPPAKSANNTKATKPNEPITITFTVGGVLKAALSILAVIIIAWLVFQLRQKLLLLLLAMFVATLVDPGVQFLERWRIPRAVAIVIQYLVAILVLLLAIVQIVPLIAEQIQQIAYILSVSLTPFIENPSLNLPFIAADSEISLQINRLLQTTLQNLSIETFVVSLQQSAGNFADVSEFVRFATRVAGSVGRFVASLGVVLALGFFIQLEKESIIKWGRSFLPRSLRKYADTKTDAIHTKIGQWMRGELTLMGSIFAGTFVVLSIIQMPYALTLALFAGLCEFFPAIGPIIAAVPAIIIAGTQKGPIWVLVVMLLYYAIQWCENNILVPVIMRRAVGLSPVAILFAMMVGISFPDTIHPVLGIMLAVPTTTIIAIFINDWRDRN